MLWTTALLSGAPSRTQVTTRHYGSITVTSPSRLQGVPSASMQGLTKAQILHKVKTLRNITIQGLTSRSNGPAPLPGNCSRWANSLALPPEPCPWPSWSAAPHDCSTCRQLLVTGAGGSGSHTVCANPPSTAEHRYMPLTRSGPYIGAARLS